MFLNNYLKNSRAKNKYCVETAVAIICLIALTSRIKMDRRCALKEVKQSINQMGENSAFHIEGSACQRICHNQCIAFFRDGGDVDVDGYAIF